VVNMLCSVTANPRDVEFKWTFNNSAEIIRAPHGRTVTNFSSSTLSYTPVTAVDYGTLMCTATNQVGSQKDPCIFHIIMAGSASDTLVSLSPHIVAELSPDVIAINGRDTRLSCTVESLGNNTVSWIRHLDACVLTIGRIPVTSDKRFSAYHPIHKEDWQLRIMGVKHSDGGLYECQLSTSPPIRHFVRVSVVDPMIEILGGPDIFIDQGSTINLTCVARFTAGNPWDLVWYHNQKKMSFNGPRPGISSIPENGDKLVSQLLIQRAKVSDSGDYKCQPKHALHVQMSCCEDYANITLHVSRGNDDATGQRASHFTRPDLVLTVCHMNNNNIITNIVQ